MKISKDSSGQAGSPGATANEPVYSPPLTPKTTRTNSIKSLFFGGKGKRGSLGGVSLSDLSSSPKHSALENVKRGLSRSSSLTNLMSKLAVNSGGESKQMSWEVMEQLANQPGFKYDLSQFSVIKQIGSGAFGRVLLCTHDLTGQKVVLKAIDKRHIKKPKHLQHLKDERDALKVLSQRRCPFIAHSVGSFQDEDTLYFVMEYVPGGELFAHLRSSEGHRFKESRARFYIAEIILALQYMHEEEGIVYRDLKPENMLLDEDGHVKVIDFGFAKQLDDDGRTFTFCGTPDYLAPEVIAGTGYGREADYWALGVLTFELISGRPPFLTVDIETQKPKYDDILSCNITIPKYVSGSGQDLIKSLLRIDPKERLGARGGWEEIKAHTWFLEINWEKLLAKEIKPPKPSKGVHGGVVNVQASSNYRAPVGRKIMDDSAFAEFEFVIRGDGDVYEPGKQPDDTSDNLDDSLVFAMDTKK